jgi:diguanylate cyclase (GGDEF)-like protein
MLDSIRLKQIYDKPKYWYWLLFILTLLIGLFYIFYVAKTQDAEMRDNLLVYAKTIEQSIDWRPHAALLNTNPDALQKADLSQLQLNSACKANKNCHFIYLLYTDTQKGKVQVKFLLDASPQPASEISHLGEVFVDASEALKQGLIARKGLVDGPVTDHWGTWVSSHVPLTVTAETPNFVMLGIDVAVSNWNQQIIKKIIAPSVITFFFLVVLAGLIYQSKQRETLLTQLFKSTSALSDLANNDALTGLPNRRLLQDRMEQALKDASRDAQKVAVLFLDLDFFKAVNDSHGHLVGDQLLKQAAKRLTALLRTKDTVARIGGDEFVILLPQMADEAQVTAIAETILEKLAVPFQFAEMALKMSASIGIALFPEHDVNADDLIKCADSAMYSAKRKGRNCYAIYHVGNPLPPEA